MTEEVDDVLGAISNLFHREDENLNEVEVMRSLEKAIREGNIAESSILAIKLAERKADVSITRKEVTQPIIDVTYDTDDEFVDADEEITKQEQSIEPGWEDLGFTFNILDFYADTAEIKPSPNRKGHFGDIHKNTGAIPKGSRPTSVTMGDMPTSLNEPVNISSLVQAIALPKLTTESLQQQSNAVEIEEGASCVTTLQWTCEFCTLINHCSVLECAACGVVCSEHQEYQEIPVTQMNSVVHQESLVQSSPQLDTYQELLYLNKPGYVANLEPFECSICLEQYGKDDGVMLRNCLHVFCKDCIVRTIEHSDEPEVKCPYMDDTYKCNAIFQDCEIRTLATQEIYDKHLAKSIRYAESQMTNTFHCKTPNCSGWCIYEDQVNFFPCPVCLASNCLTCQAIHPGRNCQEYQEHLRDLKNPEGKITLDYLNEMVRQREGMHCPKCNVIIMKKMGCDGIICTMCRTEICWVTRGPRWGPGGKGDTSGGCRCGFNGQRCHPNCQNCH